MNSIKRIIGSAVVVIGLTGLANAQEVSKTVRATDLSPSIMSQFDRGEITELTIEFRQSDRLPVTLSAEGDLLETAEANPGYLTVKRNFWVKLEKDDILMSLDGSTFMPLKNVISGSLTAGASSSTGNVANAINVLFKAALK